MPENEHGEHRTLSETLQDALRMYGTIAEIARICGEAFVASLRSKEEVLDGLESAELQANDY